MNRIENKKFTSKMDRPFAIILAVFIGFIMMLSAVMLLVNEWSLADFWTLIGGLAFTVSLVIWLSLDIKYEFREEYLFLKAGFIFTKIRYEHIEGYNRITSKMAVFSGFTLLSSTKAVEILASTVLLGCVKISPSDLAGFIEELERRMKNAV